MNTSNHENHIARWREFLAEMPLSTSDAEELLSDLESLESSQYHDWLDQLSLRWRRIIARNADPLMRSPLHRTPRTLPNSELIKFTYERCGTQAHLEQRLFGTHSEHYLGGLKLVRGRSTPFFCLMQTLENLYLPSADNPFRLATFGLGKKEREILQARAHGAIRWREAKKPSALFRAIRSGGAEAVFLPAISPDFTWRLDPDELVTSFRTKLQDSAIFLVLDLTLVGENFDIRGLLDEMGTEGPSFVLTFERRADHLQMGLDLAEVSRIVVWEKKGGQNALLAVLNLIGIIRSFCGLGLNFRNSTALQVPSLWNADWREDYSREKAQTNRLVAESLQEITTVRHQQGGLSFLLSQVSKQAWEEGLRGSHYKPKSWETESGLQVSFDAYRGDDFDCWLEKFRDSCRERFPKPPPAPPPKRLRPSQIKREWKTIATTAGDIKLPLITITGQEPGPRLSVTAGIHGTEFVGVQVLLELADELKSGDFRGTLVLCPLANPPSFFERAIVNSPLDSLNPNRSYPGSPGGRPTERIVNFVLQSLIMGSDAHLDLHSGEFTEKVSPFLGFSLSKHRHALNRKTLALASNLGISDLTISRFRGGRTSTFAGHSVGVPAFLVEVGYGGRRDEASLKLTKDVILNAMAHLGMTERPSPEVDLKFWIWGSDHKAPTDGLWFPEFSVYDKVHYGQTLGRLKDALGKTIAIVTARDSGRVMYGLSSLSARKGDVMANIAVQIADPREHEDEGELVLRRLDEETSSP